MRKSRKLWTALLALLLAGLAACSGGPSATPTASASDTPYAPAPSNAETVRVGIVFVSRNDPYKISAELRACLEDIYDLRDGTLPAEAKEDVIQRLNENGFRELFEEWEARYEEYKALQ